MSLKMAEVYDAAEYLKKSGVIESRSAQSSKASDVFLACVARALVFMLAVYTTVRFIARQARYAVERKLVYRHTAPQQIRRHVAALAKIPRHVAFVLRFDPDSSRPGGGLDGLLNSLGQVCVWSLGAGSQQVTVYERVGALQDASLLSVRDAVVVMLARQFGSENVPLFRLRSGTDFVHGGGDGSDGLATEDPALVITLMSERDGRPLMARLAREYATQVASGSLDPAQITVPFVHKQLTERVGDEPDLLVMFGSRIDLEGFSPWHLRITELFCLPDNHGVLHYLVFYRALQKFSTVKINLGA